MPDSRTKDIARVRADLNDSRLDTHLWDEYICQRRPVVIEGTPTRRSESGKWNVQKWLGTSNASGDQFAKRGKRGKRDAMAHGDTIGGNTGKGGRRHAYLRQRAGQSLVSVEYRSSSNEGFGRGKRRTMRFAEFLTKISSGHYYISSSQQTIGPHGFPDLMVSPLIELRRDIPTRLSWAGNLVPQQVNLWFGSSVEGTSSGLHHDYHDNFFVLLRGKKRFRLFPPTDVLRLQTHGVVLKVHDNGRIVYRGQERINADGSHQDDVDAFYGTGGGGNGRGKNHGNDGEADADEEDTEPPSFSKARVEELGVMPLMEFELHAGESLYLPAGWFHEVTSVNDDEREHMALNYWLHPPTNLQQGASGFERPYISSFWPDVFETGLIRRGEVRGCGNRQRRSLGYLKLRYGRGWHHHRR